MILFWTMSSCPWWTHVISHHQCNMSGKQGHDIHSLWLDEPPCDCHVNLKERHWNKFVRLYQKRQRLFCADVSCSGVSFHELLHYRAAFRHPLILSPLLPNTYWSSSRERNPPLWQRWLTVDYFRVVVQNKLWRKFISHSNGSKCGCNTQTDALHSHFYTLGAHGYAMQQMLMWRDNNKVWQQQRSKDTTLAAGRMLM